MILKNEEMRTLFSSISHVVDCERLSDPIATAQQEVVDTILGRDLCSTLDVDPLPDEDSHITLRGLVRRAIGTGAYLGAIPELDLVLTEGGFTVQSNEAYAPASRQRVDTFMDSLKKRKDQAYDSLTEYLLGEVKYASWKQSPQFKRLSQGLIFTFRELTSYAVFTHKTKELYPKSWSEFWALIPTMTDGLMAAASFVSVPYALDLLEKARAGSFVSDKERYVVDLLKRSIAAHATGEDGKPYAMKARGYMMDNLEDFPLFAQSKLAQRAVVNREEQRIVQFL